MKLTIMQMCQESDTYFYSPIFLWILRSIENGEDYSEHLWIFYGHSLIVTFYNVSFIFFFPDRYTDTHTYIHIYAHTFW